MNHASAGSVCSQVLRSRRARRCAPLSLLLLVLVAGAARGQTDGEVDYRVVFYDESARDWVQLSNHTTRDAASDAAVAAMNGGRRLVRVVAGKRGSLEQMSTALKSNDFIISRDRAGYAAYLGQQFAADERGWRKGTRVLDAGAGEAVFLRQIRDERGGDAPELVAVSAARPETESKGTFAFNRSPIDYRGIDYREGLLGVSGAVERGLGLGTFDAIVDVYGASHYAEHFDRIVESYGSLLRSGGRAYLHISDDMLLLDDDGEVVKPVDYLRSLKGMRLVDQRANGRGGVAVVLERTKSRLRVPRLELVDYLYIEDQPPPVRRYRLGSNPQHRRGNLRRRDDSAFRSRRQKNGRQRRPGRSRRK